jgi:CO dehydrogenase/acetyl-CoA synthase alpha subunit
MWVEDMANTPREVSLREFIESSWFKLLARGLMILGTAGIGYVIGQQTEINKRLDAIEQVAGPLPKAVGDVQTDINTMKSDITQTKVAVGRIEGMLKLDREATVVAPYALDPPISPVVAVSQ